MRTPTGSSRKTSAGERESEFGRDWAVRTPQSATSVDPFGFHIGSGATADRWKIVVSFLRKSSLIQDA